jgi:uncharacterized membrane protein
VKEQVLQWLESFFGDAHALIVFVGSAIPITEQRATIPLGIYWGLNPFLVFILALAGSYLPVPILVLLYTRILEWLSKVRWLNGFTRAIDQKVRRHAKRFEKSTEIALILFVSIPLPGTGLWTGSMIASVLGFNYKKSLVCIALGGLLSAVVLTLAFSLIRYGFSGF